MQVLLAGLLALAMLTTAEAKAQGPRPEPAAAAAPASLPPVATRRTPFTHFGAKPVLELRGNAGAASVDFGSRSDELVTRATFHFRYAYSPALVAAQSHIRLTLNNEVIGLLPVVPENAGRAVSQDIDVDPRLFVGFNRLTMNLRRATGGRARGSGASRPLGGRERYERAGSQHPAPGCRGRPGAAAGTVLRQARPAARDGAVPLRRAALPADAARRGRRRLLVRPARRLARGPLSGAPGRGGAGPRDRVRHQQRAPRLPGRPAARRRSPASRHDQSGRRPVQAPARARPRRQRPDGGGRRPGSRQLGVVRCRGAGEGRPGQGAAEGLRRARLGAARSRHAAGRVDRLAAAAPGVRESIGARPGARQPAHAARPRGLARPGRADDGEVPLHAARLCRRFVSRREHQR